MKLAGFGAGKYVGTDVELMFVRALRKYARCKESREAGDSQQATDWADALENDTWLLETTIEENAS